MSNNAIPTRYEKCEFRSRIEARWAVFFDALGVKWEYEKQGFKLPVGWYLPDFFLPAQDAWFEVKGAEPTIQEMMFCHDLAEETYKQVFITHGGIESDPCETIITCCGPLGWKLDGYAWHQCETCGAFSVREKGATHLCQCGAVDFNPTSSTLEYAAEEARSVRFDNRQEKPVPPRYISAASALLAANRRLHEYRKWRNRDDEN